VDQTPVYGNSEQMKTRQALEIPTKRLGVKAKQKIFSVETAGTAGSD
jgi:hypothetical protein